MKCIAGSGIPAEREDYMSDDVEETESLLGRQLQAEMNGQEFVAQLQLPPSPSPVAQLPPSPVAKTGREDRDRLGLKRPREEKSGRSGAKTTPKKMLKDNSELFPADMRPEMFADDDMFNALAFEKAATFVHEHGLLKAKIKSKSSGKNSHEKSDDVLKKVKIPEGEDDAGENINIEARKALRPVNKELSDQMKWYVTKREQIVRNLPLDLYGLADSVPTKAIELAHDLTSHMTIDMFCPGGKKSSNVQQKAMKTKDGELAVETIDVYGELDSVQDVLLAWNTLQAIWQKIFPEWPAAVIAQRVIIKMRNFHHCSSEAKDILIRFSNRLLTSFSQRAAAKKKPLSFDKALNLAGSVCMEQGYSKEPAAQKGNRINPSFGGSKGAGKSNQVSQGAAKGGFKAGRGGGSSR